MLSSSQCKAEIHKVDGLHLRIIVFRVVVILVKKVTKCCCATFANKNINMQPYKKTIGLS